MCGIGGILYHRPGSKVSPAALKRMADTIVHRGPDDEGLAVIGSVGLAFRRLAIIDLSDNGHQPMATPEGDVWVVFNGEIYNFRELREELKKQGVHFKSQSDTEVLLQAYRAYGRAFVTKLNGMFAFALWDDTAHTLVLGRDRLGKKPLYYRDDGDTFMFGSEIKAILAVSADQQRIDTAALDEYFAFGYIGGERTILQGIQQIPPATIVTVANGAAHSERYWYPSPTYFPGISEPEALEHVEHLLEDAVRIRLESDVPLGAFLSGGIDSSLVVAFMARISPRPIKTYTIGFEEADFDEAREARVVADYIGSEHTEELIRPDYAVLIEDVLCAFDQPFGDSSALPTYVVSKLTRNHVTVVLSGDGGDEVFGGYDLHRIAQAEMVFDRLPVVGQRVLRGLSHVYPAAWRGGNMLRRASIQGMPARYIDRFQILNRNERAHLLEKGEDRSSVRVDPSGTRLRQFETTQGMDDLMRLQLNDIQFYLPDDILVKVDRMSMLNSLETRSPFLDYRVVELGLGLPADMKVKNGMGKKILRDLTSKLLPREVAVRPKRGFAVPLERWFRSELRDFARDHIFGKDLRESGIIDMRYVERLFKIHQLGLRDVSRALWLLLAFAVWLRRSRADVPRLQNDRIDLG